MRGDRPSAAACSRPWKKWPPPGNTTTGSSCGRAQSSTSASGTTSSSSPWMTIVSVGHRLARRTGCTAGADQHQPLRLRCLATRVCTNEPNEKPASTSGSVSPNRRLARRRARRARPPSRRCLRRCAPMRRRRGNWDARPRSPARERLGQRLHDLVVERAALQRMRMRDQRDAGQRGIRTLQIDLERPGRPVDRPAVRRSRGVKSSAARRPRRATTWRSMISSMSSRST